MSYFKRVAAVLLAVVVTGALVALSQVPFSVDTLDEGALRLSWRVRAVSRETCRTPTQEELANTPAHMRQPQICEIEALAYSLQVVVDGDTLLHKFLEPSGARADRPLYIYEEIRLPPGEHMVDIHFSHDRPMPNVDENIEPVDLAFTRQIQLQSRDVVLVTYDESTGQLVTR